MKKRLTAPCVYGLVEFIMSEAPRTSSLAANISQSPTMQKCAVCLMHVFPHAPESRRKPGHSWDAKLFQLHCEIAAKC
jgi:hypothetical protein